MQLRWQAPHSTCSAGRSTALSLEMEAVTTTGTVHSVEPCHPPAHAAVISLAIKTLTEIITLHHAPVTVIKMTVLSKL